MSAEPEFLDDPPATAEEWQAARMKSIAQRRDKWRETLAACGVPERYQSVPPALALPEKLSKWPDNAEHWCFTLLGPPGTGKTWLAVRLLGEIACTRDWRLGAEIWFSDSRRALEDMKAAFGTGDDDKVLRKLLACRFLVLDDAPLTSGQRPLTDWTRDRYSLILMERHAHCKLTVITSNASGLDAFDAIDPRVTSRLYEGFHKTMAGQDRRRHRRSDG